MIDVGLVSVVIPVYNVERYLRDCVDSVLGQSYSNLDVILVDDGSADGGPQICDRYAELDPRVRVIHQENEGVSAARNRGLEIAQGEYIYFLDSDDYIAEDALEKVQAKAVEDNLDVVLFDGLAVDEFGEFTGDNRWMIRRGTYSGVYDGQVMFSAMRGNADYSPVVQRLFIRKQVLQECSLRFYNGIFHEDELFTFLLMMHCRRCGHLPESLFYRRWRSGSIMTSPTTVRNVMGYLCIFEGMATYYSDNRLEGDVERAVRKHVVSFFWNTYSPYKRRSRAERKENAEIKERLFKQMKALRYLGDREISQHCRFEWFCDLQRKIADVKRRVVRRNERIWNAWKK
jgi:glycosyltransferase involved in cell wall biosynthesis